MMADVTALGDGWVKFLVPIVSDIEGHIHETQVLDEGQYDLMQFTGLHDKNGKEIYEGDVVKSNVGYGEFKIEVKTHEVYRGGWYPFCQGGDPSKSEVIGNIYEHGHLIGK